MPGEESETEDGRYPLPDYGAIDASGCDVNNKNILPRRRGEIPTQVEADPDPDWVVVPDYCFGYGWLDKRVGTLNDRVDLEKKKFYFTVPRRFDKSPKDVPVDHPLRAIARVLHESPPGSNIRGKSYLLTNTNYFAIELLHISTNVSWLRRFYSRHPDENTFC